MIRWRRIFTIWCYGIIIIGGIRLSVQSHRLIIFGEQAPFQEGCPSRATPGSIDSQPGALDDRAKSLAFEAVVQADGRYGDYTFRLNTRQTPPGFILPVLPQSIAGIESGWTQYDAGNMTVRNINVNGSCDDGMLQVNSDEGLSNLQPSYLSDVRGNIAAGTQVLAGKWNSGAPGVPDGLPVVNDIDPEPLIHWYHALSAYNGGPAGNSWANNPNCGQPGFLGDCDEFDYRRSRELFEENDDDEFLWTSLGRNAPGSFPYQERVLYNLAFPIYPQLRDVGVAQWKFGYPGLIDTLAARNSGILPDDSLFQSDLGDNPAAAGDTSLAPNILLFTHYPPEAVAGVAQQPLTFAFDLPLDANVTIDLLDTTNDPIPNTTLINAEPFPAGWSTVTRRVNQPLPAGAGYRIVVERGDRADATTWYVGQYRQAITIVPPPAPAATVAQTYLPLIGQGAAALPANLVRNGDFADCSPLPGQTTQPAYWQVQTIINTEDGIHDLRLDSYTGLPGTRMRLRAAPRARQEIRQRMAIPERGNHTFSFEVEVANMPPDSLSQLAVRVRPVGPGPVRWNTLRTYTLADNGTREPYTVTLPVTNAAIILSFLATFDAHDGADLNNAETTRFLIDNVQVRPGAFDCVPPGPCQ
jgi:hypothetical protein